eukprot:TRINITY_DN9952_c0_g1_i1.p1 TRINITY_DN9952_c0_g1~~TRINITY_DN9952_c0_g1_i1.p1  ORF type:complete len:317 (-),score=45.01 TRINITY_DN9952_c0_g1_i1:320-1270(-)
MATTRGDRQASFATAQEEEDDDSPCALPPQDDSSPCPARFESGYPKPGRPRRLSKAVSWVDIDGSCEEIFKFEVISPDACARLNGELVGGSGRAAAVPRPRRAGLTSCFDICAECFKPERAALVRQGRLWKLNHEESKMEDLQSWRRRLFFLRRTSKDAAFVYISEKEDGSVILACLLHGKGRKPGAVKIEELDPVRIDRVSKATKEWVTTAVTQYELAFSLDLGLNPLEEMADFEVPSMLYPISLSWEQTVKTKQGEEVCGGRLSSTDLSQPAFGGGQCVIAASSQLDRRRWIDAFRKSNKPKERAGKKYGAIYD